MFENNYNKVHLYIMQAVKCNWLKNDTFLFQLITYLSPAAVPRLSLFSDSLFAIALYALNFLMILNIYIATNLISTSTIWTAIYVHLSYVQQQCKL